MAHKNAEQRRAYHRAYYAKHGDGRSPVGAAKKRARGAKWHLANKERRNAEAKLNYTNNKAKARARWLKADFGLSLDDYLELLTKQNGVCAICLQPETSVYRGQVRHLAVDHNHETGKVRGLLCLSCNTALGHLKENPTRLLSMLRYIQTYNGTVVPPPS